jgi:hypothetical protein
MHASILCEHLLYVNRDGNYVKESANFSMPSPY